MNSQHIPYFFLYCASQNYAIFHPYGYPLVMPENKSSFSNQVLAQKQPESGPIWQRLGQEVIEESLPKPDSYEKARKGDKKCQIIKKQQKDVQFKQRQQTTNRNLCSNTLKIYFKQLRDKYSETNMNIRKIIEVNKINMTTQEFFSKVDKAFPPTSTYISFDSVKKMSNHFLEHTLDVDFAKILRTSIVRFYSYEIYAVNIKSIRTTRKIRNQQIKQGKVFLRELSL